MVDENSSQEEHEPNESGLTQISGAVLEQVTGLPAPVQKTFWKVFGRLATSAADLPVAYLEGKAAEIRAVAEGKVQAIRASSKSISAQIDVPPAYVEAASAKFAERIVGKQKNLDAIAIEAAIELPKLLPPATDGATATAEQISDDWLNTFEVEAENMSSDYMRTVFGKLLAGEISRPGSFSRRAVKVLGQMGKAEAEIFARFCSLAMQFASDGKVSAGLLLVVGERPTENGLAKYQLNYLSLLTLVEYGLVMSAMDGAQEIELEKHGDDFSFIHSGRRYRCVYEGQVKTSVRLYGIVTSRTGAELMQLVTPIPDQQYTAALKAHLKTLSLRLEEA